MSRNVARQWTPQIQELRHLRLLCYNISLLVCNHSRRRSRNNERGTLNFLDDKGFIPSEMSRIAIHLGVSSAEKVIDVLSLFFE